MYHYSFIKKLWVNLFLFIIAVLLGLFLIEVFFRLFNPQPLSTPMSIPFLNTANLLNFRARANKRILHSTEGYKVIYNTNGHGFRGSEYPCIKKEGVTRILVLGDSFTFGLCVNDADTYCNLLQRKLDSFYGPDRAEVVNFGVPGIGTAQEFLLYNNEGIKYDPDIVIIQFYSNDLEDSVYRPEFDIKSKILKKKTKTTHPIQSVRNLLNKIPLYDFVCEHSHLASFVKTKVIMLIYATQRKRTDNKLLDENIKEKIDYLEKIGIKYFDLFENLIYQNDKMLIILNPNGEVEKFPNLYNHLKDKSDKLHLLNIDIPVGGYYRRDIHWNSTGHRLVAEEIFTYLVKEDLIKNL